MELWTIWISMLMLTITTISAPATPYSVEPNSGLEVVEPPPNPIVAIHDLLEETQKTLPIIHSSFHDVFKRISKLAVRKSKIIKRGLDRILKDGIDLSDPIIQATLESINPETSFEEFAPHVQSTLEDLQAILALVTEQLIELVAWDAPNLEDKVQKLLNNLEKSFDSTTQKLFAMITATKIVVSVTQNDMAMIKEYADSCMENVRSLIGSFEVSIESFVGQEEANDLEEQLDKILEETIYVGSERINLLVTQLKEANVDDAASIVEQTSLDLESLFRQASGEVKDLMYMVPPEITSQVDEMLNNLVNQVEPVVMPFTDLILKLGKPHIKGL